MRTPALGFWLAILLLCASACSVQHREPTDRPVTAEAAADDAASGPRQPTVPPVEPTPAEPSHPAPADPGEAPLELDPAPEELTESPHDELAEAEPEIVDPELAERLERVAVESAEPDLPIETNEQVLAWVDYYANQHPRSFQPGLVRSGRYVGMFREIFAEAGIPRDLVYMAHVESAYKTNAYSRARAKGIFQFIAATGRRYGLRIDYWVDDRSDPEKSARAAAAYLVDLYEEFGDWYLALAAYNAGEGKIRRALARSGKKDFWGIAKTQHIRRETRNYVPAILAAILISKNPASYGFDFEPAPRIEYDSIVVEGAADLRVLARCAGSDLDTMRGLNPALRRQQTPPNAQTAVRVPTGAAAATLAALDGVPVDERVLYARHKVTRGDSLWVIAQEYGVSVGAIQQTNAMGRSTLIREGQVLVIPTASAGSYDAVYSADAGNVTSGKPMSYRVRSGDNLYRIARSYRTTSASIASASGIEVDGLLRVGQRLTVVPGVSSPSEAARIARGGSDAGRVASNSGDSTTHTVRRGDTLWRIASQYRTTVAEICSINRISPDTTLHPGVKLAVAR